tara:strand:- start:25 stop:396 length:372 start_codon:yes stop_codon:yes gene_type:complete
MKYKARHALSSLCPGAQWVLIDRDLNWLDDSRNDGFSKPTWDEIDAKVASLNTAEPMRLLRVERDARLTACDWTQSRDITLSNDADWKTYRKALRDLPASASPKLDSKYELDLTSVTWPTEPS